MQGMLKHHYLKLNEVITPTTNMELPILARESARFQSTTVEVATPIQKQENKEEEEEEKRTHMI